MNIPRPEQLMVVRNKKDSERTNLALKVFGERFSELAAVHGDSLLDGFDMEVPVEVYLAQVVVLDELRAAGWEAEFSAERNSSWSMTAKSEHEFAVYKVRIRPATAGQGEA